MRKLMFFVFVFSSLMLGAQINPDKQKPQIGKPNLDCIGATNKLNLSTGIDPTTGTVLPVGQVDPEWKLMNYPPLDDNSIYPVQIPNAYVIPPYNNPSWNYVVNAGILSSIPTNRFSSNNLYRDQPWRFRRNFCVCEGSEVRLKGNMRADDKGSIHLFNSMGSELYSKKTADDEAFKKDNPFDTKLSFKTRML